MPRILIVEDDPLILRMYQSALKFEKFDVDTAGNGKEGLEFLKNKPNLILLDIMMPAMNGLDFLKSLKESDEYKNIPVVVMTNLSGSQDVAAALSLGAVKFIVKSQKKPREVVADVKEILAAYTRDALPGTSK